MILVLSPSTIREQLRDGATAAVRGDGAGLDAVQEWLSSASGRDLLRIDGFARQYRYDGPTLGQADVWTPQTLERSVTTAALASMHPNGFVRERAVRMLATADTELSNRMLALRAGDHVAPVRALVSGTLMTRLSLNQAASIMPVLNRFEPRGRGTEARARYLESIIELHGSRLVFEQFRASVDRDLRRAAFQLSLELGLLATAGAVDLLPRERDQVVRRLLARVVASHADSDTIREVLLNGRAAEGRALALMKLDASKLDIADVNRLLVDSSVLVRYWARRRWEEMGRDVTDAYWKATRLAPKSAQRAFAYVGLKEVGVAVERPEVLDLVHSAEHALRKVGLQLLAEQATVDDVPEMLDYARSDNSRVGRLACEVLARNSGLWSVDQLADIKGDADPDIRRRGWWLHRSRRGWEAPLADLEVLTDPDPRLAMLGREPSAPMYFPPSEAQRERIAQLLPGAPLDRNRKLVMALAAGLDELVVQLRSAPRRPAIEADDGASVVVPSPAWWRRILARDKRDDDDRRRTSD